MIVDDMEDIVPFVRELNGQYFDNLVFSMNSVIVLEDPTSSEMVALIRYTPNAEWEVFALPHDG